MFLPVAAVILFLLVPLFKYLVPENVRNARIYNLTNLGAFAFISLLCIFALNIWAGSLVTLIGTVWIVLSFDPHFHLRIKKKYLILAGYLIFMTLTNHYPNPIFTSVALMAIALACVGAGFKFSDKSGRLCGLILAIFVCVKVGIYDFRALGVPQRILIFMIVGAIALLISLIYIRLEKTRNLTVLEPKAEDENILNEQSVEKISEEAYNNTSK
jgi:hypothetical protein